MPTLDLLASINLAQNDATSTQGYQYKNKLLGMQYTVPLFGGGGLTAGTRQAGLNYEASLAESEALLVRLENDFDTSWAIVLANNSRLNAMLAGLASGKEQVNSNRRSFELGVKSIAESANAELSFAKRMTDVISITQEYLKYVLRLSYKSISLDELAH